MYRSVYMSACCSCAGPDRWIRVWHQWMKWPPRVLPGSWPRGSSVLALPPRTRRGGRGGGDLVHYSTPMHHAADTHTHTDTITHPRVQAAKHPSITSLDSSGETENRFSNRRPISQCDRKKSDFSINLFHQSNNPEFTYVRSEHPVSGVDVIAPCTWSTTDVCLEYAVLLITSRK